MCEGYLPGWNAVLHNLLLVIMRLWLIRHLLCQKTNLNTTKCDHEHFLLASPHDG